MPSSIDIGAQAPGGVGAMARSATETDADAPASAALVGGPMAARPFRWALAGIVTAGLAFRVGYVLIVTRHENAKFYDAFWYTVTSNDLTQGHFFRSPFANAPSAAHPPLTSLLLGSAGFLMGRHSGTTHLRLTMAVLGAAVVLCVGLLGRAVAGPWVGLTAAGLAAFAPNFWIPSGIVMSETPAMLFMALILLAVVRLSRSPTMASAALLGAACGAEALVRAELIVFVPCLLVPAMLLARPVTVRRRLGLLAMGLVVTGVVLAPWVGRNLATFADATYTSTGEGIALLGANCPSVYGGPYLGTWALGCARSVTGHDESVVSTRAEHAAATYARHHLGRLPVVVLARVGRLWDLYQPIQMAHGDVNEGRPVPASLAGLWVYYATLALGVAGVVILRRRRIPQWFLLVPAGVLTLISALVFGMVRFRAPFEVCLVVLAAAPLVLAARALGGRLTGVDRRGDLVGEPARGRVGS
jgi:4-amino-4-deoxy-L-arabinose transferase-like glycosyltransferase